MCSMKVDNALEQGGSARADSQGVTMAQFGYKLMTETTDPRTLVRNARLAEEAGFDFVSISDHFHPWLESHGHSPFAWSVLGAIAETTEKIGISTGLTCPIMRYHPAIIAQAAATIGVMSEGRFTLAVGAGERLNEHVVGQGWPAVHQRHAMLHEAVEIVRLLWRGETCSYEGEFFHVDSARIYDLPQDPIPSWSASAARNPRSSPPKSATASWPSNRNGTW